MHDGSFGKVVLVVEIPDEIARGLRTLPNEDDLRPCRETIIPAEILDKYPVVLLTDERN